VERLFVGVLSLEAAMFVWDQGILVGFPHVIVPFSAILLIILRRRLLTCQTWAQLVRVVNYESKAIPLSSLQSAAELWLMPSLQLDYGTVHSTAKTAKEQSHI
jgi:hypothetical protein